MSSAYYETILKKKQRHHVFSYLSTMSFFHLNPFREVQGYPPFTELDSELRWLNFASIDLDHGKGQSV